MVSSTVGYFCTLFVYVTAMIDSTMFGRDFGLDDKLLEEIPAREVLSISRLKCASHCQCDVTCLAFVHNHLDGRCELFTEADLSQQSGETLVGNVMFKKIVITTTGGEIENSTVITTTGGEIENSTVVGGCETSSIPDGELLNVVGQREGSRAYVCDDFYYQTGLDVVCTDGVWTGVDTPCREISNTPSTFRTLGFADPGHCFTLLAEIPSTPEPTQVSLKSDDNTELFLGVTINLEKEIIQRKSKIGGIRDTTETDLPYWPLVLGGDVNLTLCTEDALYRMYIDSVEMFTHNRRLASSATCDKIRVQGFVVRRVTYKI